MGTERLNLWRSEEFQAFLFESQEFFHIFLNAFSYELSNAMGALNEKSYFGKYTVIHGTGDDNVHFQNSAVMTKEIINKGFEFNAYFYADEQHGINSDSHQHNHVYGLIWRKLNDCLNDRL